MLGQKMNEKNIIMAISLILFLSVIAFVTAVEIGNETCREDIYECTDWTECAPEGTQTRSCTLISTCPDADNDVPLELMDCEYQSTLSQSLECGNLGTIRERVQCRLDLNVDAPQGLNIAFMPEECGALFDEKGKDACIMKYSDVEKCWNKNSEKTDTCLKQQFNLNNIAQRKTQCGSDATCLYLLSSDVNDLAKLRIHELEFRAETMLNLGLISENDAIDIISYMEQQKLAFQNSPANADRVRVLSNVKSKWKNFIDGLGE